MRRAILLLLALALLLSGCVRKQAQPPLQELLKLDELFSLAAPPEEPPAPTVEEPLAPQTAGDPLPSTGVWVDESVYTPRAQAEAKYTRPAGDLSRYVPGQGPVYPYCAGENQYGFCTAEGVLVTDPIYEEIGVLNVYDSLGFSLLYRVIPHPSGPDDRPQYGVVAADGSFAIDCTYDSVFFDEENIKCTRGEMTEEYDLYDRQGRLLLSARGLDYTFSAEFPEERRGEWFLVYSYTDSPLENYYVSADSRRLGPYFYTYPFSEGLACVSEDGSTFGYIDETGAWAITPRYNMSFTHDPQFRNGRAIQNTDDGDVLIDRAGNILIACHSNCLDPIADGQHAARGAELLAVDGGAVRARKIRDPDLAVTQLKQALVARKGRIRNGNLAGGGPSQTYPRLRDREPLILERTGGHKQFWYLGFHEEFLLHMIFFTASRSIGASSTIITAGKIQSRSGPSIFTGASLASRSARSNRRARSCSD